MSGLQHATRKKKKKRKKKVQRLTTPMIDRLFWRAGFGPSEADRKRWHNKPVTSLVDWFLKTRPALKGAAPTRDGNRLDPTTEDVDLVLEWVDRMIRSTNPFPERLAFFLHRHFANARDGGPSQQMLRRQIDLFRSYSDFSRNPNASFRDLVRAVTVDPSMLRYLTGEDNVRGHSNENYAREVMELFCLGVRDRAGRPTYTEGDIKHLARAFTGWQIDESNPDVPRGVFDPNRWSNGLKSPFGVSGNFKAYRPGDPGYKVSSDVVELVLKRPPRVGDVHDRLRKPYETHARFFLLKLWHEFIVAEPDAKTMNDLVKTYLTPRHGRPGLLLKPVLRKILSHKLMFESINEPNMVKPPVVFVAGMYRSMGLGIRDQTAFDFLDAMGQLPYNPPNVSGWEGGLSWLTTNTVLSRFALAGELMDKKAPVDRPGESSSQAVDRALREIGRPWVAKASLSAIKDYAARAPSGRNDLRIERQRMIRALVLAGPDAQVM